MRAYVVGTIDTKGVELHYLRDCVVAAGVEATLVDVSTSGHQSHADVSPMEVAEHHPAGAAAVFTGDRGSSVEAMSEALRRFVLTRTDLAGILGAGGSGGTALVTPSMRALPVGVPKVMVSTVASGDVGMYVGPSDIAMMYSVTDVAGLNRISRQVLGNAAHALAGMIRHRVTDAGATDGANDRPLVGLTMFGVTTPLVSRLANALEERFEPLVFHATGTGGQSMEKLVDSGLIAAVLDMTTTEIADHLVGGVFSAGPDRLGAIARSGVPYVGSVGAVDMVNFGPIATVPPQFRDRRLHVHNPQVTLMRTTPDENVAIGRFIAEALNRCDGPVRFLLPEGGVSLIDAPGQPFHDPDADAALFDTIEHGVTATRDRVVERVAGNINDDAFADRVLEHFADIVRVGT